MFDPFMQFIISNRQELEFIFAIIALLLLLVLSKLSNSHNRSVKVTMIIVTTLYIGISPFVFINISLKENLFLAVMCSYRSPHGWISWQKSAT